MKHWLLLTDNESEADLKNLVFKARDKEILLGSKTSIMGILNVTPDSFSDGGKYNSEEEAVNHARDMIVQGADVIDIGGESTRPGFTTISDEEEISRIKPVIARISKECNIVTSVDTYKFEVSRAALEAGAHIINDVTGLKNSPEIANLVKEYNAGIILMFNMRNEGESELSVIERAKRELSESVEIALAAGISEDRIMTDPGIGFGTTRMQDIELTKNLSELSLGKFPILYACSRKRITAQFAENDRDDATMGLSMASVVNGADMIRVHNVKKAFEVVSAFDAIYRG